MGATGPTAALLAAVLVLGPRAGAAVPEVRYDGGRVSASFQAVPVGDALDALARASGAEVRGSPIGPRDVTLELDAVPVDEALQRLLGTQNFTVTYGSDDRVKAIVLQGGPSAPPAKTDRPPAAGVPVVADTTPHFPLVLSRIFDRHRPLDVPEPLAERLGTKKAGMPELLEVATADEDGVMRAIASNSVLTTLERQSRYRRSFMRTLHRLDPDELGAIATGPSGGRFEELLVFFSAHSREPGLQKKSGILLEQLREARAAGG